jgi:hypothetical protein
MAILQFQDNENGAMCGEKREEDKAIWVVPSR